MRSLSHPARWLSGILLAALLAPITLVAHGDEGMWLLNNPPKKLLKEKHGFEPTDAWLMHLQQSSVRVGAGGSASFVSSEGLVLTNHHVADDTIQKLSTPQRNLVAQGFYARTREEELKCHDLELNVLASIEDVTDRVNAAVPAGASMAEAEKARRGVMNTIEQESHEKTGLRSDVVTLYQGGLYHLYRFKRYTDVRLVFAPEQAIAFLGGDPDNFEYPRYNLDITFLRVYENGKPAKIDHFLKWSHSGPADGELVFVTGHPGKTERQNTVAHLEFLRDLSIPSRLEQLFRAEVLLKAFAERSPENARRAEMDIFGVQNARKAILGRRDGLQDPSVMARKLAEEKTLREAVGRDPKLKDCCGDAWDQIAAALGRWKAIHRDLSLLEQGLAFRSRQFSIARTLVRMAEEDQKPNAERLREYRASNRQSIELLLFSEAPVYDDLETLKLADSLAFYMEQVGADDPLLRSVLAGQAPRERAAELIRQTKLADVSVRRKLAAGGLDAIRNSTDPMIQLARLVDEPARRLRRIQEEQIDEPLRQGYAKIAKARFAISGTGVYPDATFTLRLAFGLVKGYAEMGREAPPFTTLGGAYRHCEAHGNIEPFVMPPRWRKGKDRLNLDLPFNFVSTADIIGGNSGSPTVNRAGEFVGIIFDGNLDSLVWDFVYTDRVGRAISVHSAAIEEALRKLYDAGPLADELGR